MNWWSSPWGTGISSLPARAASAPLLHHQPEHRDYVQRTQRELRNRDRHAILQKANEGQALTVLRANAGRDDVGRGADQRRIATQGGAEHHGDEYRERLSRPIGESGSERDLRDRFRRHQVA